MIRSKLVWLIAIVMNAQLGFAQTQFIQPLPAGYSHATVVTDGKLIFVSGQVPVNELGETVGKNDLRAQTTQVYENLKKILAQAGATFQDVVKMNTYVVNYKPSDVVIIREVRKNYLSPTAPPASTLVGVTALVNPDYLIEIELVAALKK